MEVYLLVEFLLVSFVFYFGVLAGNFIDSSWCVLEIIGLLFSHLGTYTYYNKKAS